MFFQCKLPACSKKRIFQIECACAGSFSFFKYSVSCVTSRAPWKIGICMIDPNSITILRGWWLQRRCHTLVVRWDPARQSAVRPWPRRIPESPGWPIWPHPSLPVASPCRLCKSRLCPAERNLIFLCWRARLLGLPPFGSSRWATAGADGERRWREDASADRTCVATLPAV